VGAYRVCARFRLPRLDDLQPEGHAPLAALLSNCGREHAGCPPLDMTDDRADILSRPHTSNARQHYMARVLDPQRPRGVGAANGVDALLAEPREPYLGSFPAARLRRAPVLERAHRVCDPVGVRLFGTLCPPRRNLGLDAIPTLAQLIVRPD